MLIAVDGFEGSAKHPVGVGRFEVELLKEMARVDLENSYRIYTPSTPNSEMPRLSAKWKYKIPPIYKLWSQVSLPSMLFFDRPKPDVFFAPVHYAPRYCPSPYVVGIMDLSFLFYPELFKKTDLYKLKNWTEYSVKAAKAVIAISNSTKNDILKAYSIEPDMVHVVYPGIRNEPKKIMENDTVLSKYDIKGEYILYVGTLQPRKNIERLIEAFKILKKDLPTLKLVIVGKKGWLYDSIFEKVRSENLVDSIIFTGYVTEDELATLYHKALCFCLVSLYEGFGFPVLEAMREGVPVVASNTSSLPELVEKAGVLVNPEDAKDIARGIKSILIMNTKERKSLIEKGFEQVKKFTWENAARQTIQILEEVGNVQR